MRFLVLFVFLVSAFNSINTQACTPNAMCSPFDFNTRTFLGCWAITDDKKSSSLHAAIDACRTARIGQVSVSREAINNKIQSILASCDMFDRKNNRIDDAKINFVSSDRKTPLDVISEMAGNYCDNAAIKKLLEDNGAKRCKDLAVCKPFVETNK